MIARTRQRGQARHVERERRRLDVDEHRARADSHDRFGRGHETESAHRYFVARAYTERVQRGYSASVPLETPIACPAPTLLPNDCSNRSTSSPKNRSPRSQHAGRRFFELFAERFVLAIRTGKVDLHGPERLQRAPAILVAGMNRGAVDIDHEVVRDDALFAAT